MSGSPTTDVSTSQSLIPEGIPVELEPIYRTLAVNDTVVVYQGELALQRGKESYPGNGSIALEWLPVPTFRFRLETESAVPFSAESEGALALSGGRLAPVTITGLPSFGGLGSARCEVSGVGHDVAFGAADKLSHVSFHVPNFRSCLGTWIRDDARAHARTARVTLEADGWRITIDEVPHHDSEADRERVIEAAGGFGITHIGKLERTSGACFSDAEWKDLSAALFWFLSFCRGSWVGTILPVGFGKNNQRVWDAWEIRKISRWSRVDSWFDPLIAYALPPLFRGFMQRWREPKWSEPVRLALHWYVEANM